MRGSVYLIGGGEIAKGETEEIDDSLKAKVKGLSTLVFFPTAAGDSEGYIKIIELAFSDTFTVIAATEEKGRDFALQSIDSASVIYLGGGNTDLLVNLFEKWNLAEELRMALERGIHIAGMSAGAYALSAWYAHQEGDSMELRRGLGLVPYCTLAHATADSVPQAKALWENNAEAHVNSFIAISEKAAWVISETREYKIGNGEVWR